MKKNRFLEYFLPSIVAWFTNRRIREGIKKKDWDDLSDHWKQTITAAEAHSIENAVGDLYQSEIQRKEAIESKAASLFEAIGFAVSLVSVATVFGQRKIVLILLVFPLANFILAGICCWHATKIGEFFVHTLEGIKENLRLTKKKSESESKRYWIIEKLVSTEMNCPIILMKSNWLAAAYQHFLLGILSIVIVFLVIIVEPYFIQILEFLNVLLQS